MRNEKQKGMVMIFIIALLALMPIAVMVMSKTTQSLAAESVDCEATAQSKYVLASSLVWSKQNAEELSKKSKDEEVSLDVSGLGVRDCTCDITVLNIEESSIEIEIEVELTRGKRHFKRKIRHSIERVL
jgi:hypothetical protein